MRTPLGSGYPQLLVGAIMLTTLLSTAYIYNTTASRYSLALTNANIAHGDTLADSRLAYEHALAERDPIFNLAGTDPSALRNATSEIAEALEEVASFAPTEREADLIHHLYPIMFLQSLADAEEARMRFVLSPTPKRSREYDMSLIAAAHTGRAAVRDFTESFAEATEGKNEPFANFSGIESRAKMLEELAKIEEGLKKSEESIRMRSVCKLTASCAVSSLMLPSVTQIPPTPPIESDEIIHMYEDAGLQQGSSPLQLTLHRSVCIGIPGPHSFIYDADAPSHVPLRYVGDIFFIKTGGGGPVLTYMREILDMARYPVNPYRLYNCPAIGKDISTALAVVTLAGPLDEASMRAAVQENLLRARTGELTELISLAHMLEKKGGGLDVVAGEAAYTLRRLAAHRAAGIPVETSAAYLYLTHSAFPSIFQAYNPSFGTDWNMTEGTADSFLARTERYSSIRQNVPRAKLVADMHAFFTFEGSHR